jgi:hypothetical protein
VGDDGVGLGTLDACRDSHRLAECGVERRHRYDHREVRADGSFGIGRLGGTGSLPAIGIVVVKGALSLARDE